MVFLSLPSIHYNPLIVPGIGAGVVGVMQGTGTGTNFGAAVRVLSACVLRLCAGTDGTCRVISSGFQSLVGPTFLKL